MNSSATAEPPRMKLGYAQVVQRGVDAERRRQTLVRVYAKQKLNLIFLDTRVKDTRQRGAVA